MEGQQNIKDFIPRSVYKLIAKVLAKRKPKVMDKIVGKLIAKVLIRRMVKVMEKVVGECQHTFVEGMHISNVALVADEIVDDLAIVANEIVDQLLSKVEIVSYASWTYSREIGFQGQTM